MENHPIPQDVTGFQFKLIGNMTVKQFAYLATGAVFAWILLQLPVNILIKFPFGAFSALFGAGLAFFPISGRPMDLMIGNYIKALFRPTEFIYEKTGGQIYFPNETAVTSMKNIKQYRSSFSPFPKDKLKAYLESLDTKPKNKVDDRENNFLLSVSNLATGNTLPNTSPELKINPDLYILKTSPKVNPFKYSDSSEPLKAISVQKPAPLPIAEQKPINQTNPTQSPVQPTTQTANIVSETKPIIRMAKAGGRNIGLPSIPDSANIITGTTKDPRGNALSNILIEVKDREGNPVRAFKTNEVGRFASATPLANGSYTIEFEDPKAQNRFEKMAISVTGQIISPIEATSIDTREELRRSLFAPSAPGGAKTTS